jgi:hypothetical protein
MNMGRVGEERGSKEMDGCPLTGMLRDRPSDWSTLPLADCMLSLMDRSYARPMSWQTASDMAIIWDPGSMIPSTSSLLLTTIVIDHKACNS